MNAPTQSPNPASARANRSATPLRVALAAGLGLAIYFVIPSQPTPAGADAAPPHADQHRIVRQAHAGAAEGVPTQSGYGMPAPSSTATEGNVVDMTY